MHTNCQLVLQRDERLKEKRNRSHDSYVFWLLFMGFQSKSVILLIEPFMSYLLCIFLNILRTMKTVKPVFFTLSGEVHSVFHCFYDPEVAVVVGSSGCIWWPTHPSFMSGLFCLKIHILHKFMFNKIHLQQT